MKKHHKYYFLVIVFMALQMYSCASLEDCCDDDVVLQDTIKLPPVVLEDTMKVINKDYRVTIQIGAFRDKAHADIWSDEAKTKLNAREVAVRLDNSDGLYKVTVGVYDNVEEANAYLKTVISRGYLDAFVRDYR